ncbi:MAG TPA: hypothetical protein VJO53_14645 [Candidatus Acidoferrales bacterium]|nr:hypothetical protein [Candidatus Acidoferrales bacterium]
MRMSCRASLAAAAILSVLAFAAPPSSTQQIAAFQCVATSVAPGAAQATIYVSELIPMAASQRNVLTGAWRKFVQANYHLESVASAICNPLSSDAAIQQRVLTAEANAWQQSGLTVVQVNWKPGQAGNSAPASAASLYSAAPGPANLAAPPAPPAPAPVADPASAANASYCYSDDRKPTVYISDAFYIMGLPPGSPWSAAFNKFLAQKYGYKGTVTCKSSSTIVTAQSMILDQRDAWQKKQIVETDWTYEPPAPAAQ